MEAIKVEQKFLIHGQPVTSLEKSMMMIAKPEAWLQMKMIQSFA